MTLFLLFPLLFASLVCAAPLYVVDCGSHGAAMMALATPNATFVPHGLKDCDGPGLEQALSQITLPARISLSWGNPFSLSSPRLLALLQGGARVYAGTGNEGRDSYCPWPASEPGVIAVMALDSQGNKRSSSNGCSQKNGTVVGVSACSASEATVLAASASLLQGQLVRAVPREDRCDPLWWQWIYAAVVCALALLLLAIVVAYCKYKRRV